MLSRAVNEGFSGGEKKRNEIFQMALLEPKLAILDETDSGLDIDALKIVANGVNAMRSPDRAIIVVTHYQRLLDYIVPDYVHVLSGGRIVKSGGKELALELEAKGYGWIETGASRSERDRDDAGRGKASALAGALERARRAARAGCRTCATAARVALRRARLPDRARRGVALHERRADRRRRVPSGAGRDGRRGGRSTACPTRAPLRCGWSSSTAGSPPSCRG